MRTALKRVVAGIPLLLPFVGLFFIVAGVIGLLYIQQPLSEPQDPRSQASIEDGTTEVVSLTTTSADLKTLDQETTIVLGFNTNNLPINQLTTVFNIVTETADTIELQPTTIAGITTNIELETTTDGYLAEVQLVPENGTSFSSNFNQEFVQLVFTPTSTGELELNFDTEESVAINVDTAEDSLTHIPTFNYTITAADDNSQTINSCNEQCQSNADCETGHRCYNTGDTSRCRLATNPSSSSCEVEDDSEKSQCNQSCETSRDCAAGLSCYQDQCRNPENLTSTSCASPATTTSNQTSESEVQGCNQACTTNNDCEINLRCYQGSCRLATNPSSTSCSASNDNTVSDRYTKGGLAADELEDDATESAQQATDSAEATTSATPTPTISPTPTVAPDDFSDQSPESDATTIDESLPISTIAVGAGLLILGIAALLLIRAFKSKAGTTPPTAAPPTEKPPTTPPQTRQPPQQTNNTNSNMVDRLKQKGVTPPSKQNDKS